MPSSAELFAAASQLQRAGRLAEAADRFGEIVRVDPGFHPAWHELGVIAYYFNRQEQAFELLSHAILLDGSRALYHHNMGACCRALGRLADAEASYRKALRLEPEQFAALAHLWATLRARGEREEAEGVLQRFLALAPRSADDAALKATVLLSLGRFDEAWPLHERRLELPTAERRVQGQLKWDGSPPGDRTLLVYGEQGLGDTLQMLRYVPLLERQGIRSTVVVQNALVPLVAGSLSCPVTSRDELWPAHDMHIAALSLPWSFRTTPTSVPGDVPYLRAKPELVEHWKQRLADLQGLRVGICWQGNRAFQFDRARSFPLTHFAPLAGEGIHLISLQSGFGSEQLADARREFPIVDFTPQLDVAHGPFMDTAAIIENLDLVITSDTAIAHLAGALAARVWLALSTMPDWRWMYDRDDSPWYPTMRLFRQSAYGDWSDVFVRMAAELRRLRR